MLTGPLLSLDPGIFYHSLALSAFCLSARPGSQKHALRSEGLLYYGKGVKSINDRLGNVSPGQVEGLVLSILAMANHTIAESIANGWCWEVIQFGSEKTEIVDQFVLHFRALKGILDSHGGVDLIDRNSILRRWLFL